MRVAFYYGTLREPNDQTNPYGNLLVDGLGRQGVDVRYVLDHSASFITQNTWGFDAMHWHWPSYAYSVPSSRARTVRKLRRFLDQLRLARALGWHVVWTAHNLYPHNRTHHDLDREFRQEFSQIVTAIISHCESAADAVRSEFKPAAPIFVIPHGNFIDVLPPSVTRIEARQALGIDDGHFVYGFIGNLLPYKGLEELIDAFRETDDGRSWLLISGGTRPREYGDSIVARAAGHPRIVVRSYDYAPGEAFVRVLQASDVIVLPFRASTTSGSLVQALSWPRPCIVPSMGCLPNQMEADAGILYPPDEPGALADALRAARRLDLAAAREAAWRSAIRADWDDIARRTIEAYSA